MMRPIILMFVLALWVPTAVAKEGKRGELGVSAEERVAVEPAAARAMRGLEEALARIDVLEERLDHATAEVRQAQQEWQQSRGVLSRTMALDRLRVARKNHHSAARQLAGSCLRLLGALAAGWQGRNGRWKQKSPA